MKQQNCFLQNEENYRDTTLSLLLFKTTRQHSKKKAVMIKNKQNSYNLHIRVYMENPNISRLEFDSSVLKANRRK